MKETVYRISNKKKMKIALVADLHNVSGRSALLSMEKNRPDLIAVSGDLIAGHNPKEAGHKVESQKNVLPFVRRCAEIAPTFVSVGNHEWPFPPVQLCWTIPGQREKALSSVVFLLPSGIYAALRETDPECFIRSFLIFGIMIRS